MAPPIRLCCWALFVPLGLLAQPGVAADPPLPEGLRIREAERLTQDAKLKMARGDYDAAIESFTRAIALDPKAGDLYRMRATLRGIKKDFAGTVADADRALQLGVTPSSLPYLYWNRAMAYHELGQLERAVEDLGKVVDHERFPEARFWRGNCYTQLGNFKLALADYDRVLAKSPGDPRGLSWRGTVRLFVRDYRAAVEDLSRLIERPPPGWGEGDPTLLPPAVTHYYRGYSYLMLSRFEEAAADFSRSIELDEWAGCYRLYRAAARLRLADLRGARADVAWVIRMSLMKLLWEMREKERPREATG